MIGRPRRRGASALSQIRRRAPEWDQAGLGRLYWEDARVEGALLYIFTRTLAHSPREHRCLSSFHLSSLSLSFFPLSPAQFPTYTPSDTSQTHSPPSLQPSTSPPPSRFTPQHTNPVTLYLSTTHPAPVTTTAIRNA